MSVANVLQNFIHGLIAEGITPPVSMEFTPKIYYEIESELKKDQAALIFSVEQKHTGEEIRSVFFQGVEIKKAEKA